MKKIFFVVCCLFTLPAWSQTETELVKNYLLNFSVPDQPAFKSLGTDPSNILRPADVKQFALEIAPFYSNKQGVIPNNFALEFAPWKMLSKKWSVEDYNKKWLKQIAYRSAFSIGTLRDSSTFNSKLSVGYRVSITSKEGDIIKSRHNGALQQPQQDFTDYTTSYNWLVNTFIEDYKKPSYTIVPTAQKAYMDSNHKEFKMYVDSIASSNQESILVSHAQTLKKLNKKYKVELGHMEQIGDSIVERVDYWNKKYWNASRLDLAIAWVGESSDTLLNKSRYSSFNAWATWAIRCGDKGQLLIGTSAKLPRTEDSSRIDLTGNVRYYVGGTDVRGFIEGQYKYKNIDSVNTSLLLNIGSEFKISNAFWVVASAGVDNFFTTNDIWSKFVGSLSLRYGFNGKQ